MFNINIKQKFKKSFMTSLLPVVSIAYNNFKLQMSYSSKCDNLLIITGFWETTKKTIAFLNTENEIKDKWNEWIYEIIN